MRRHKTLLLTGAAVALALLVNTCFLSLTRIVGKSMEPTLCENDWVLLERWSCRRDGLAHGDIVVFQKREIPDEILVKRVIGVPGDTIEIDSGKLYRNGALLEEPFPALPETENREPVTLGEDDYYVLGDNRLFSIDSRSWEDPFVHDSDILGRVTIRFFPRIEKLK